MEIILLEKIRNVGQLGEKVKVRNGYGRNFLIPQGKAVRATEKNLEEFESRRAALEEKEKTQFTQAEERAKTVEGLNIRIKAMAGEEGKLYGSIGTREIADAITANGIKIEKSEVRLPAGVLRYVGEYDVDVQFHADIIKRVKIAIVSEE